jgi:hypothetical protein
MATVTERLALLISADVQGAVRGLNEVGKASKQHLGESEKRIDKVGRSFSKVGAGMLAIGGAAAAGLYQTVDAASDLEQAVGGTEAVFKDASNVIDEYAKDAAKAAGLSERAFREATTGIGGNLKRMGFSVDEAAEQSANLTQVAADLAATYGGTTAEAVSALGAAFRGEADPAERFNLNLKASVVSAKAVELGLAASTTAVDENARAQALLALIAEQSADAQGQFAREADSAAGSAQIAAAQFENAKASLGESLAPVMADVAGLAATLFDKFNGLNESTGGFASKAVIGATGLTLFGGAALTGAGKVIQLNRSLRDTEGNLGRTGKAMKGLAGAGAAIGVALTAVQALDAWAKATADNVPSVETLTGSLLDFIETGELTNELVAITGNSMEDLGKKIELAGNSPFSLFDSAGIREVQEANAQIDALDKALAALFARDPSAARELWRTITDEAAAQGVELNTVKDRFNDYTDAVAGASNEQRTAAKTGGPAGKAIQEVGDSAAESVDPIEELEDAIKGVNDALRAQFDPLFAARDALIDNQEAQRAVTDAEIAAKKAQDDLNGAVYLYGKDSPEATEAARALEEAQRGVDDANRAAGDSALDVTTATNDLAGQMRAGNIDIAAAENQIRLWAEQGLITEQQAEQMTNDLKLAAIAAGELNGLDVKVMVSADTTRFWQAISDLYSGEAGVPLGVGDAAGPLVIPQFDKAEGGFIPGPKGAPVFGIAHGGEYVVSNEELDAMRRSGLSAGGAGPSVVIQEMNVRNEPTEDSIVRELRRQQYLLGAG